MPHPNLLCKKKIKMALRFALLLLAYLAFAPVTDCQILAQCGDYSCPDAILEIDKTECCVNRVDGMCCTSQQNVDSGLAIGISQCGDIICPTGLPTDRFYDDTNPPQLRNECCEYFQSGCCSAEENSYLFLLFQLAIGLSIGLAGLLAIIIFLVVCCCCCCCC